MAAAAGTDVRAWLQEQGHDVPKRGPLPAALRAIYDEEHDYPGDGDPAGGDVSGADPLSLAAAGPGATAAGERAPRRAPRSPLMTGARERLWGPRGRPKAAKAKSGARGKHARVSLAGFAEDLCADLAWLAGPLPPVQKILHLETPYVGVVFEDAVRGSVVDRALQPAARNMAAFKAVNGLLGPPVYVAGITMFGGRVEVPVVGPDGRPLVDAEGAPVTRSDFDSRTKAMFLGLKYSLMQMAAISPGQLEQVQARSAERSARSEQVDAIIEWIFSLAPPAAGLTVEGEAAAHLGDLLGDGAAAAPPPAASWPGAGTGWPGPDPGYPYPPAPPGMDGMGGDPGRASLDAPTPGHDGSMADRWVGGGRAGRALLPADGLDDLG